jgi:Type IV secretory system Conjugative DNA transfer
MPFMAVSAGANAWQSRRWSDGIWNSGPGRRLIGLLAGAALIVALAIPYVAITDAVCGRFWYMECLALAAVWPSRRPAKIFLGRATRPLRRLIASRHAGMGGTARFSGLLDDWANPWKPGLIMLGCSKYDPNWIVGIEDDRHICTLATNAAGKGRSLILNNLLTWPGSALVVDPKGQNAYVTALVRGPGGKGLKQSLGQKVRIIDPLNEILTPELQKLVARFNPLSELDPSSLDYVERVAMIADALVVPSAEKDSSFFDNAARKLIMGVIDYVMMSPNVGQHERNLATVRGVLAHPDGPPFDEMSGMGGLAQAAAAANAAGGDNSTGDVTLTAMTHTEWLDSLGMQRTLEASDFSLRDLNDGNTTVYLVLPPDLLEYHGRFPRLFVNLAMQAAIKGRKKAGKHATLFLLDEFYSLGRLSMMTKAAGLLRGYGVKLWPIIQNIGQVDELYGRNWETFLGNAGIWTAFAMNDQTTADYLAKRLGKRILWRKMRGQQGFEWEISGTADLRDPQELGWITSRESKSLAAFREGGDVFLLGRVNYDEHFPRRTYSPDPFEPQRPKALRETMRDAWAGLIRLSDPPGGNSGGER